MSKETKDEVIEAIKAELIKTFGKITSQGYVTLGIVYAALNNI